MKSIIIYLSLLLCSCSAEKDKTPKNVGRYTDVPKIVDSKKPDSVFHIKVKYFTQCKWTVSFTNDNFYSEEDLKTTFDIGVDGIDVSFFKKIFDTEQQAISFAQRFKTYSKCRKYNDSVYSKYLRLVEDRKRNPPVKTPEKQEECKDQEGQEFLVH